MRREYINFHKGLWHIYCSIFLRKKTATPPSDDLGEVKEAYIEAMRTVARPNPPHRCNLFFDFVAETAKSLSAKEQDELMRKCHIALLEVRYEENN